MDTLKELKKAYPHVITTSGNNYYIDGLGWYKQRFTVFGIETYRKNFDNEWTATSFNKLVEEVEQFYGGK